MNAASGNLTSVNSFTASYYTDSASFDLGIQNVFASESKYLLTSSFNTLSSSYHNDSASFDSRINSATPYKISSGSVSVTTYADGKVIAVSGSKDGGIHFTVSGSGSFTGTVDAASFYQNSLRALKENIHPFTASAVELINDLDIVTFNYKRLPNLFKIGIIADDSHEYIATKEHNSLWIQPTASVCYLKPFRSFTGTTAN